MKIVMIPTDELKKVPWNYKTENAELTGKLLENIKRNGILRPSIVYEKNGEKYILDGNHRIDVYRELGIEEVPSVFMGEIDEAQAKRIALEVNETQFQLDYVKLSELINEIAVEVDVDELALSLPFTSAELNDMKDLLDFEWDDFDEEEFDSEPEMMTCKACGREFEIGRKGGKV